MKNKFFLFAATALVVVMVVLIGMLRPRSDFGSRDRAPSSKVERKSLSKMMAEPSAPPPAEAAQDKLKDVGDQAVAMFGDEGALGMSGAGVGGGGLAREMLAPKSAPMKKGARLAMVAESEEAPAAAPTRSWFPETFLFEPLVVTNAQGVAEVPVKVPDRLTTWRVLALAHGRNGAQAGAETSLLGTLPVYVDPVLPPKLYAGDSVRLPIQIVNTTPLVVSTALSLGATGAVLAGGGGTLSVPAEGNTVQFTQLKTNDPGTATITAKLGTTDAVERSIEVVPAGTEMSATRGGSLGAPRTFTMEGPTDALPKTEHVTLRVYPGALGLLRAELMNAANRGGVNEDAYFLQLLGQAPALLSSLGSEVDAKVMRDLIIVASQRALQQARSPSFETALAFAEAARAHPENAILQRLAARLTNQVRNAQRPDGTCQGATGWTAQRLMVTTADCLRVVTSGADKRPDDAQRATLARVRASGAFERFGGRVNDGYTAATILASGAVSGTLADALKKQVLEAIETTPDGTKALSVADGVVRSDGRRPSMVEATAVAVLALKGDSTAPLADLGAYLLSQYSPSWGWGDGATNRVALAAVSVLFKDPVPSSVSVTLSRDGVVIAEGTFDAAKLKDIATIHANAQGSSGAHEWTIAATPPVPGLGFALALSAYKAWKPDTSGGMSLQVVLPAKMTVGQAVPVELAAAVPGNTSNTLRVGLPAGVQPDRVSLDQLVTEGTVDHFETEDGAVTLFLPPLANGKTFKATIKVVPTLAGSLLAMPSKLTPEGRPERAQQFAPARWSIQ